ncbi:hypothetical protein AX17_002157 [Amanita inopinata Kibby_2008]|nr:hypothetical protein AX17_002157 [Amanita inopinata Kibby_2008]
MPLLHWSTLQPSPSSDIAAVRFAAPIRVSSLSIFPTGARPFSQSPEIVACTEPDAFFLQVFFNAQPIKPQQPKDKQRAVNALIPSVIAYSGGQVNFTVDMGMEYASRLMIIKGAFQRVSLAVYGSVISEPSPVLVYEPKSITPLEPVALSQAVDPANSSDPSELARKLLSLVPDSPSLSLVVRLMFCLKPSNDDWDHPDFPYLHAYIDSDEAFDLESVVQNLSKPLPEETTLESLETFAVRVAELIGPKDSDQSYYIAKLLSISASQIPEMARILLQRLDLETVFDAQVLDEETVNRLLDAAANVDIARHFNNASFLEMLKDVRDDLRTERSTQYAIDRLISRIQGWGLFEDALSNVQGDFYESSRMLKDIGTGEQSIGVWLESMIIHDDITSKITQNPHSSSLQPQPPLLLSEKIGAISHDDFILFVKAFVGVASVLAVWAWSDSIGNDACREQSLAILHLWQNVGGYRQIVNHLLLLRQLTRRLGWITSDNAIPRNSGTLAERVLVSLAQEPDAIMHDDLISTILSLRPPLSHIADSERLTMRKVALVAEDGLSAALEELAFKSDYPLSLRRLRTLRVSLAIVLNNLEGEESGEWHVVDTFWTEQNEDMNIRLIEILAGISQDLNAHFSVLSTLPSMNQSLAEQLFKTADDLLQLLARLTAMYPLNVKVMKGMVDSIADIFACTYTADILYHQPSAACIAAQGAQHTCLEFLRALSEPEVTAEPNKLGAEIVLQTLLNYADGNSGREPVNHLLQVFTMIDYILPFPADPSPMLHEQCNQDPSYWVTSVLPNILTDIRHFLRVLDVENRVHFLKRLIKLDEGELCIGEWLLMEELSHLLGTLDTLAASVPSVNLRVVLQHELYITLRLFYELAMPQSSTAEWCIEAIASTGDLSRTLTQSLMGVLEGNYTCQPLSNAIKILAEKAERLDEGLRRVVLLGLLRVTQLEGLYFSESMQRILTMLKEETSFMSNGSLSADSLHLELARLLSSLADLHAIMDVTLAEEVICILKWLTMQDEPRTDDEKKPCTVLHGLTTGAFAQLCGSMYDVLSSVPSSEPLLEELAHLQGRIVVKELSDDKAMLPAFVELPETLQLSIGALGSLLGQHEHGGGNVADVPPSTPKGSKTPDLLGVVISPPTALLRSPAATGLTKTYANNDFRQLRQASSSRLNTSRLPSMHVDDFEVTSSLSPALVPVPMTDTSMLNITGGN